MASILDFLGRAATAGVGAESARLEGKAMGAERDQKNLLVRLKQEQDAAEFEQRKRLTDAQIGNYESLAKERSQPSAAAIKREYDSMRGGIVDVNAGTFNAIPGLPDRPEPKGPQGSFIQYVDKEGNPVSFNPTTRETVEAPQGLKPAGAAGDRNTATVRKQVAENKGQLKVIESAIGEIKKYPDAVGLKRGLGKVPGMGNIADVVNQRVDPEGVNARIDIANIGSLIIHDRSGAAVSVSEFPRLAPFVPNESDTPETVIKKLERLAREIRNVTDEMEKGTLLVDMPPAGAPANTRTPPPDAPPPGPVDVRQFMPPRKP